MKGAGPISSALGPPDPCLVSPNWRHLSINHFLGLGTSFLHTVLPPILSPKSAFPQTQAGVDSSLTRVLQTPPPCPWLFSLSCHVALGLTTWLLREQLSTYIITIYLGLGSLDSCTFIHLGCGQLCTFDKHCRKYRNKKQSQVSSFEGSQSTVGRRQAGNKGLSQCSPCMRARWEATLGFREHGRGAWSGFTMETT